MVKTVGLSRAREIARVARETVSSTGTVSGNQNRDNNIFRFRVKFKVFLPSWASLVVLTTSSSIATVASTSRACVFNYTSEAKSYRAVLEGIFLIIDRLSHILFDSGAS